MYHKGEEEEVKKMKYRGCVNTPKSTWHALVKLSTPLDKQLIIITTDRNDHQKFDFQLPQLDEPKKMMYANQKNFQN